MEGSSVRISISQKIYFLIPECLSVIVFPSFTIVSTTRHQSNLISYLPIIPKRYRLSFKTAALPLPVFTMPSPSYSFFTYVEPLVVFIRQLGVCPSFPLDLRQATSINPLLRQLQQRKLTGLFSRYFGIAHQNLSPNSLYS